MYKKHTHNALMEMIGKTVYFKDPFSGAIRTADLIFDKGIVWLDYLGGFRATSVEIRINH